MPHHVKGVIARAEGEPVELTTVVVPDPGPGEVVVNVATCGVCHTDLRPDLERCSGFKDVSEYAGNMGSIPGEIGT